MMRKGIWQVAQNGLHPYAVMEKNTGVDTHTKIDLCLVDYS